MRHLLRLSSSFDFNLHRSAEFDCASFDPERSVIFAVMNVMTVEVEASHVVGIVGKMVFDRNDAGSAADDQELTFDSALRAVFGSVEIDRDFHFRSFD